MWFPLQVKFNLVVRVRPNLTSTLSIKSCLGTGYLPAALIALAPTAAPGSGAVIMEVMSSMETSSPGNDSASYSFFRASNWSLLRAERENN